MFWLFSDDSGISKRYLPLPEMLSLGFFISIIFVACILSSSQMALNGLQKREWMESFFSLLKMKRSGGLWRWNIRPVAFCRIVVRGFALIENFLFPI